MKLKLLIVPVALFSFVTGYLVKPTEKNSSESGEFLSKKKKNSRVSPTNAGTELPSQFVSLANRYPKLAKGQLELNRVLLGMIRDLSETDPEAAAELLDQFTDDNARLGAREHVLAIWAEREPQGAVKWLEEKMAQSGEDEYKGYYYYALNSLAMVDPEKAVKKFENLEPGNPARRGIIEGIARGWGETNPQDGFAWLKKLEGQPDVDSALMNTVYRDLMLGYMHQDKDAAASAIAQLDSSRRKAELVRPLVLKYAEVGFGEATDFIQSIEDPLARRHAAAQFLEIEGPKNPEKAIDFAVNHMDINSGKQTFLRQTFLTLASMDLPKAMEQYGRLEGDSKAAAMEAIAYGVTRMEGQEAVVNWVSRLPDPQDRDNGYAALTINSGGNSTEIFRSLARIQDSGKKVETLESIVATVSPNQLFDIRKELQRNDLGGADASQIEAIINTRISNEYGDLLIPGI